MPIRPAILSDLAAITACAAEAYEKYVERIGGKPAPMVADFEARIDKGLMHVSVDDAGHVQGFIVFYPRDDYIHLENVAVINGAQGRGIGKALMLYCEDHARRHGFQCVELYTNLKMTENLQLYPRLGYSETDRRNEDGFDRIYFRKTVR